MRSRLALPVSVALGVAVLGGLIGALLAQRSTPVPGPTRITQVAATSADPTTATTSLPTVVMSATSNPTTVAQSATLNPASLAAANTATPTDPAVTSAPVTTHQQSAPVSAAPTSPLISTATPSPTMTNPGLTTAASLSNPGDGS